MTGDGEVTMRRSPAGPESVRHYKSDFESLRAQARPGKKRGRGFSINSMLAMMVLFAVAFALIRLFRDHLDVLLAIVIGFLISSLVGMGFVAARRKAALQEAFLSLVAASRRGRLPITAGLIAFARQCGHRGFRRRMVRLAYSLEKGVNLPDAVQDARGVLPRELAASFRVVESTDGGSDAMLRLTDLRNRRIEAFNPLTGMVVYFLALSFQFLLIATYLVEFIWPRFQAIMADFGTSSPPVTGFVLGVLTEYLHFGSLLWITLIIGIPVLIVYLIVLSRGGAGLGVFGWLVPGVTAGERATVLRGVAETIRHQKPLDDTLRIFGDWSLRGNVRRRCRLARQAVVSGVDWVDALAGEGFIRRCEVPLLKAASAAGQPADTLESLADAIQSRQWYRWRIFADMAQPVLTFVFAVLVLLLCYAIFEPFVSLIRRLA